MRTPTKILAGGAVIGALALAGCGSGHSVTVSQQVKSQSSQEVAKTETVVKRCLPSKDGAPDPLLLRSKAARVKFETCAVPQDQRVNFDKCVTNGVLSGLPTKKRLENVAYTCVDQVN